LLRKILLILYKSSINERYKGNKATNTTAPNII
jgi:hypothetical protein